MVGPKSCSFLKSSQFVSSVYPWLRITGEPEAKAEQGQVVGAAY